MKNQKPMQKSALAKQSETKHAGQEYPDHIDTGNGHPDHSHLDHSHADHEHADDSEHVHTEGSHSHTHQNTKAVVNRLSRAIGHLNAVKNMVEDGRDCSEVLIQLAAVRSAINGICDVILQDHIDHCIVDAVKEGDTEAIEELNRAIKLLMK
jgi:DNA-binding FrmR family transcriptional regulator